MPPATKEEEDVRKSFIRRLFSRYYGEENLPSPKRIESREFGVITERGGMWRHLAFKDLDELHTFVKKHVPLHAYHSSAYYEIPNEKFMEDRGWQGADLVFDLDADHIEGAENLTLEEMLAAVKVEFLKLLDSYLLGDFGFDERDIQIIFSGGRGYHAHVRDERILKLDSHERREIVDYITFPPHYLDKLFINEPFLKKEFKTHTTVIYRYLLYPEGTSGWRGRFREGIFEFLEKSENKDKEGVIEDFLSHEGIGKKTSDYFYQKLFLGEKGMRGCDKIRNDGHIELFNSDKHRNLFSDFILKRFRIQRKGETDEPVTSDIKRLIRLPGSLHGKSSLVARPLTLDDLKDFEPLRDAVWGGFTDAPVKVIGNEDFKVRLKGEEFTLSKGTETELPEFAALFCMCQKRCEITIS